MTFFELIGIALIIGVIYGSWKKINFTTFLKGLAGSVAVLFAIECAIPELPKVISWVLPWTGVIIVLFLLFFLTKLIRR